MNISDILIKNSYDYVLQSDVESGKVYRIGGDVPVNPTFGSGLTINGKFTYADGTQQPNYVLTSDANGVSTWKPIAGALSGTSGTSGVNGENGTAGTSGTSGTSGVNGENGTAGTSGTSGGLNSVGPYIYVTSTYSITNSDYYVDCNGTFTVTLPTAVGIQGRSFTIKNTGTGQITVATTSSQTIDKLPTYYLAFYDTLVVESDGANWLL